MDHEATLSFDYPSTDQARIVQRSVSVEAGDIEGDRTRASVARTDATLTVTIEATDLIGLRAGLNTWLSLVEVAEECAAVEG